VIAHYARMPMAEPATSLEEEYAKGGFRADPLLKARAPRAGAAGIRRRMLTTSRSRASLNLKEAEGLPHTLVRHIPLSAHDLVEPEAAYIAAGCTKRGKTKRACLRRPTPQAKVAESRVIAPWQSSRGERTRQFIPGLFAKAERV